MNLRQLVAVAPSCRALRGPRISRARGVSTICSTARRRSSRARSSKPATRCPAAASRRSPVSRGRSLTGTVDGSNAKWGYDVVFNGTPARVDYVAELAADGTLKGNVLRNGSPSPITAVKQ